MTREEALAFVQLHAAPAVEPALTDGELNALIDQSRIVDADGRNIGAAGYVESVWATRAVWLAWDLKLSKASAFTDFSADGTSVSASQVVANLTAQRRAWRSRCIPGSA